MPCLKILLLLAFVNKVLAAAMTFRGFERRVDRILRMKRELPDFGPGPNIAQEYAREVDEIVRMNHKALDFGPGSNIAQAVDEMVRMKRELPELPLNLNSSGIPIETTGKHAWVPPGPNDQRGPCPGLNALANHNYLPHDGVVTIGGAMTAVYVVYGMGFDIGLPLAVIASLAGGPPYFSIGGLKINSTLSRIGLTNCSGLSWSHNKFEGDCSPTRNDLYASPTGNAYEVNMTFFKQFLDLMPPKERYTYDVMIDFRKARLDYCIKTNPYCFLNINTLLGYIATYILPVRLMADYKSPDGYLNHEVIKSFWGVTGDYPYNMTYKPGYEKIPENWYRRPDAYGMAQFLADAAYATQKEPSTFRLGGNTGKTESWAGINLGNLTGGIFNAKNLLEGNNLQCFLYNCLQIGTVSILISLQEALAKALKPILEVVLKPIGDKLIELGCPVLNDYPTLLAPFDSYGHPNYSCPTG
ncbi:unnamed protein product [Bemisia tabaci]|uniref:Heme haloperoxidase family profile domain-containing protein n=1 Tax=Bemisia tabaci TaxID=7038 RepID=A0A9P0EXD4_BEMTA|nr:unnamed protein product [Bemisia tabaci]